jgi:hypothetical protein
MKCTFMPCNQKVGQNHDVKIANKSENVVKLKYL